MNIRFSKSNFEDFELDLKSQVTEYFEKTGQSIKANQTAWIKATAFLGLYLAFYISLFFVHSEVGFFFICSCLGACKIFLALNVAHDAAHNAFAQKRWVNRCLLFVFDLLGANGYMWQLRHVYSHHAYANIPDHDADIKQSSLVRIFPNAPFHKLHRFQHLYMPILYGFYSLHWLLYRDFLDFIHTPQNSRHISNHAGVQILRLIAGKIIYICLTLVMPILLTGFSMSIVVIGFLIMQISASYTVAIALASAHVGDGAIFPEPNAFGEMSHSYMIHQIITTTDFATKNSLITHLYGGFNHHVIHHLFPNICHIHYPELTDILKSVCQRHGICYKEHTSLGKAINAHYLLLHKRSTHNQTIAGLEF